MSENPIVVHVIDSLGIGGAEILYVDLLPELSKKFKIVLVTLNNTNEFSNVDQYFHCRYSLDYKGYSDLFTASRKLKSIISKHSPAFIHSHLFWSTIICRMSVDERIPFYFSVHATLNDDPVIFYKKFILNFLEKLTYKKHHHMIGVTQAVIDSFKKVHPSCGKSILLHNFVRDIFFDKSYQNKFRSGAELKLITVSNLRLIKNIPYLIEVMSSLQDENVSLDIYGDGPLKIEIERLIEEKGMRNVRLMGKKSDIHDILPKYDAFVSPSKVEGFGIAVAEAMSVGLPVIVSDISVYREVCGDNAIFLNNEEPASLRRIIIDIVKGKTDLALISKTNKDYAKRMFSKQQYLSKLISIYNDSID
jgi:glycosyltransferase involved in cell wall biosynthesis